MFQSIIKWGPSLLGIAWLLFAAPALAGGGGGGGGVKAVSVPGISPVTLAVAQIALVGYFYIRRRVR